MGTVDISGLDKAELLAALYNRAAPLGMGFLHYNPKAWTREDALKAMDLGDDHNQMFPDSNPPRNLYFDYVGGRPLKVNLSKDEMQTALYNRDQGEGAAEEVVAELRKNTKAPSP